MFTCEILELSDTVRYSFQRSSKKTLKTSSVSVLRFRAYIVHALHGTFATVISAKGPNCYPRKSVHAIFDLKAATEQ